MLEAIHEKHRRTWWAFVVRGALSVAVGALILVQPLGSLAVLALVVAVWALVSGTAEIIQSLQARSVLPWWWASLLAGVISCGFGIAAIIWYPAVSLVFMAELVVLWLLVGGALGICTALRMRQHGLPWGWLCTWAVFSLVAAAVAAIDPPETLVALLVLLAFFAISSGTTMLFGAWRIRSFAARLTAVMSP